MSGLSRVAWDLPLSCMDFPVVAWGQQLKPAGSVVLRHMGSLFPDQGSEPPPLHWKVNSQPLYHQGRTWRKFFLLVLGREKKKQRNYSGDRVPAGLECGIKVLAASAEFLGFPGGSAGKESACSVGALGLIPGLGRSPGEGKGYPLQYSGLENSMDCIVHGVAKSRTRLSDFHFLNFYLLSTCFFLCLFIFN